MNAPQELGGIPRTLWTLVLGILQSNPRTGRILLFGSRARGDHRPGSDLDLGLEGPELTHRDLLDLMHQLDQLDLPFPVDLVRMAGLPDGPLRQEIQRTAVEPALDLGYSTTVRRLHIRP